MSTKAMPLKEAITELTKSLTNTCSFFAGIDTTNLPETLKAFKELSDQKDRLDDLQKIMDGLYGMWAREKLPKIFKDSGVDSIKTAGRQFILNAKMRANIPFDKQDKGFAWLKEQGMESLIKETVNANSLSSFVNAYFEENAKLPPDDAISIYAQEYISIRKT